jgi:hypothetical protein
MVAWKFSINSSMYFIGTHSFVPIPLGSVVVRSNENILSCPIWLYYSIKSQDLQEEGQCFTQQKLVL